MNGSLLFGGLVSTSAIGALLYRNYKRDPADDGRDTRGEVRYGVRRIVALIGKAPDARGTMPRGRLATLRGTRMSTSISANDHESAAEPRRVPRFFLTLPPAILLGLIALAFVLRGDYQISWTLGLVQGLGEFLPISSSAHLIITPWLFGWNDEGAFYNTQWYDVALHIGTLLALIGFFWRDWINLLRAAPQPRSADGRLFWMLVLASLPGAAIGFVLDRYAADFFRDKYLIIAATLSVMGVLLYLVDTRMAQRDDLSHISPFKALLIGLAQSLAFIPGVSRSGSTMTMGRAMGLTRETAARFSFLMAMPITFGAALLKSKDIEAAALSTAPFWLGIGVSFVVGVLAIGFLLRYLKTNSFLPFVIYRLGLAAAIVVVYFLRG
jgi:undecaprenyl-diphosphatase